MRMSYFLPIVLLSIASSYVIFSTMRTQRTIPSEVLGQYARWKQQFGKLYATPAEASFRLSVFYDMHLYISDSNQDYERRAKEQGEVLTGKMFEMNMFGDLTTEEFKARYTGKKSSPEVEVQDDEELPTNAEEIPGSEETSLSTPAQGGLGQGYSIIIRNQGSCGSCWAFASVATLEKFYFDKSGQRLSFSQQELVDCSRESNCDGGWSSTVFKYTAANGLMQLSQYPYTATDSNCKRGAGKSVSIGNERSGDKQFTMTNARLYSSKGIHATLGIYSSGKFRFASSSTDVMDAQLIGECQKSGDHYITMEKAAGNQVTVFNSWGLGWGQRGFKTIKACGENNLWSRDSTIAHCYRL